MFQGLSLAAVGTVIGVVGVLALSRLVASLLFAVNATDPLTLIIAALILLATVLIACYLPARRASRVNPLVALRYD